MNRLSKTFRAGGFLLSLLFALAAAAPSQGDIRLPIVGRIQPWSFQSPKVDNPGAVALRAYEKVIRHQGAAFLQLEFTGVSLGPGSYLEVSSLQDGAREVLTAGTLKEYGPYSSFFNGDAVKVRLVAGPKTRGNTFGIKSVGWGLSAGTVTPAPMTLCGPDNRVLSKDKRVARALIRMGSYYAVGSAWLINPADCFATAGHVLGAKNLTRLTVQFNVPLSSSSGGMRFPSPKDQYVWAGAAKAAFENGGPGRDWGVFLTLKNSQTGKYAGQVQGDYFRFDNTPTPSTKMRITGYGTDSTPRTYNLVQQTDTGPLYRVYGSRIMYRVDTMGGDSGAPVIVAATKKAVGVHTHGGCTYSGGYNTGTLASYAPFAAARKKLGGVVNPGSYTLFGSGCKGTGGVPLLINYGVPVIGKTLQVDLFYLKAKAPAFLFTGASRTFWGRMRLPFDLSPLGAKGCSILVSPDLMTSRVVGAFGGASVKLPIPKLPVLVKARFYQQWLVYDPKANRMGVVLSAAGTGQVGAE